MKRSIVYCVLLLLVISSCENKSSRRKGRVVKPKTSTSAPVKAPVVTTPIKPISKPAKSVNLDKDGTYTFVINIKIDKTQRFSYQYDSKKESQNITRFWLEGNTIRVLIDDGHSMKTYASLAILSRNWDKTFDHKNSLVNLRAQVGVVENVWSLDETKMFIVFSVSDKNEVVKVTLDGREYLKIKPKTTKKIGSNTSRAVKSSTPSKKKVRKKVKKKPIIRKEAVETKQRKIYVVQKGDTWTAIAASFGYNYKLLQSMNKELLKKRGNNIKPQDKIYLNYD
jgi:LysM repeat protein|tara:strand:+ start:221 stop:1063 length:843 start_codon:yes stop_codon:yes gene_type:complete